MTTAAFLDPGDARWTRFLAHVPHDVYHLPSYVQVAALHEGGLPTAFYAEIDGVAGLAPLLLRPLPAPLEAPSHWVDATSPYGYPTPLWSTSDRPAAITGRFFELFRRHAQARGLVTAFFRLHPLLPVPYEALPQHGTLVRHGRTIYIDLTTTTDAGAQQLRTNHRRDLRRLLHGGYTARVDAWEDYEAFINLYTSTMQRVGADPFYFMPRPYFEDLRNGLPDHLHLCTVYAPGGTVAAAGLFTAADGIVQYHLSGTAPDHLSSSPLKLVLVAMRDWARAAGYRVFHLGGGVGSSADALFHFKTGFAQTQADFYTYRMVIDTEKEALLARRHEAAALATGRQIASGYFPSYRSRFL